MSTATRFALAPTGRTGRYANPETGPVRHAITRAPSGRQGRGRGRRAICGATLTGETLADLFDLDHPRACRECVARLDARQ